MEVVHEISGAIIAITLVMTAVFVPVTFMPGPVGIFYRQFGITMATSIVLSGVVALTLTPVLCAMILKPHTTRPKPHEPREKAARTAGHAAVCLGVLPRITYLYIVGPSASCSFFCLRAASFRPRRREGHGRLCRDPAADRHAPHADHGRHRGLCRRHLRRQHAARRPASSRSRTRASSTAIIQTPPGSTLEYTNAKSHELQEIAKEIEEVTSVTSLAGYEVLTEGRGSNAGTCLINLKPWSDRKLTSRQIIEELEEKCRKMTNVKLEFFEPPAVPGFGAAGGFSMRRPRQDELRRTTSGSEK